MSLRVAVIGSGPAGFYAAGSLLAADRGIDVDMIERLPTPWGLVRLGVAPDHPNIKAVSRAFEKIAARPGFRFLGNVDVGRDLAHEELVSLYDAVVYAVGAQSDRRMDVEGEDLPGSWPATAFVAWYNGHPDFQDCEFDLDVERAVVIGNGNVAVDVARMLALTPEELSPTDTTDAAIAAIAGSPVREIVMLGRRGPAQAAFTTPELKELGELAGADVIVDPADLELDPVSEAALEGDTNAQRNLEVLREYAAREPEGKGKRLVLRFLVSPVEIAGEGRVESVEVVRNRLEADARGRLAAVATDERETIPAGLVLRSVGYRGVPVPGVPFDEDRGTIRNEDGRALDAEGRRVSRVYAAGWIKRGPSGVIGTNKKDAAETVKLLLEDLDSGALEPHGDSSAEAVDALLDERGVERVLYAGWTAIDEAERTAGEPHGRPRVKLCTWRELLEAAAARA
jgi:ferredoxin--NADP+ reductase